MAQPEQPPPPHRFYNLVGIAAFTVSLAMGTLVRLLVPDEIMAQPKPSFSTLQSIAAGIYTITYVAWMWIYFRTPDMPRITLFGLLWSIPGLALLTLEAVGNRQYSLLPSIAIFACFTLLLLANWLWQARTS